MKATEEILDRLGPLLAFNNAPLGLLIDTRYEVKERLARGGMGEVFAAWDIRLERPVAMKILAPGLSSAEWHERFKAEAKTLTSLDHPGIVPIYDFGVLPDERLYYTMKFVPGRTLAERIAAAESNESLIALLADACEVVHYAHDQGILHRDLKPANIIADEQHRVFVLDWGIASILEATGVDRLSSAGSTLGTPEYMSPERIVGRTPDRRSDVFSLGAILCEILTGHLPVNGRGPTASSIPRDLRAICAKALARNPERRYPTVRALGNDLRRFLSGEPVKARPLSWFAQLEWNIGKHRKALLLLTAIAIIAVGWEIQTAIRRAEAVRTTLNLLERGRPAIDKAHRYLYTPNASYEDLVRQVDEGQDLLKQAVERDPALPLGHYLLGRAWELKGEWGEAERSWRKAIELDPNFGPARYQLGRLLTSRSFLMQINRVGDPTSNAAEGEQLASEAVSHLDLAMKEGSGFSDVLQREVASALLANARGDTDSFSKIVLAGVEKFADREGVEDLYWLSAFVLPPGERRTALDRAISICPNHFWALVTRAVFRTKENDLEGALNDYTTALRVNPCHGLVHMFRGGCRFQLGDLDGAITDLDRAVQLDPEGSIFYVSRGNIRHAKGDLAGEQADAEIALRLDPHCVDAYMLRGRARLQQGDATGALEDFEQAISLHPDFADTYLARGKALERLGNREAALKDYDEAIRLKPKYPQTFFIRAMVRQARGDVDGALQDYNEAIRLLPRDAAIYSNRAGVRHKKGDVKGAIEDLKEALRIAPPEWPPRHTVEERLRNYEGMDTTSSQKERK